MSRENVEVVRRWLEGLATEGFAGAAERYLTADAVYKEDPVWPESSVYEGRQAVVACFERYTEALGAEGDWIIAVERVVDAGDRQVPFVRMSSRGTSSGVPHEHVWAYVVEVRDGRIAYFRAYYEPAEALEAVGIRE